MIQWSIYESRLFKLLKHKYLRKPTVLKIINKN